MKKKIGNFIYKSIFIIICFCIVLLSFNANFIGQVLGFKEITTYDRRGGKRTVKVAEAGDAVKIPSEVKQTYATFESYNRNDWSGENKEIYNKWSEQGKSASDEHWAYINIGGQKRYLVAVAPTFGQTGDYIDITFKNGNTYPCIIGDIKDIWVDPAYVYNSVAYGHQDGGKCVVVEVCTELANSSSNYSAMSPLLNKLIDVQQIANGGNMFEHPDGPVGLDGNYTYDDGSSSDSVISEDDEAGTFLGGMMMGIRSVIDAFAVGFENDTRGENNPSVFYDIKNLDITGSSSSSSTAQVGDDGFVQYYQTDYPNTPYGSSTIKVSGCGPTCFAMIASTRLGKTITPGEAGMNGKYYIAGQGTSWDYFAAAKKHFNLSGDLVQTGSIDKVVEGLQQGAYVISSQGPGLFTTSGHYIVLSGIDANGGISVKDPLKSHAINKGYNTRKFTKNEINQAAKQYWIFYP